MHSWLMFENKTSSTKTVGRYSLKAGDKVTVGTWGNLQYDGVWYNVEARRQLTHHVSTSINLSSSQLSTVTSTIKNNNAWSLTNNCSTFAVKVWNSVASTKLSAGTPNLPTELAWSIRNKTSYQTNYAMPKKTSSQTYATVKGANDYIIQVKDNGSGSSSFSAADINQLNSQYNLNISTLSYK
ncbi:MAG: hypothetical protein ACLSVX_01490 [Massilimicrobiota timonensis]